MREESKSRNFPRRLLPSPATDARGRDVWPLLHRSLREMKWDRKRSKEYQRLVFGSLARMWGIIGLWAVVFVGLSIPLMNWSWRSVMRNVLAGPGSGVPVRFAVLTPIAVGIFCLVAALVVNWWYLRRNAARRIVPGLLAQGRCAACLYTLERAPVDSDGCTVCSECGSAWRMPAH